MSGDKMGGENGAIQFFYLTMPLIFSNQHAYFLRQPLELGRLEVEQLCG